MSLQFGAGLGDYARLACRIALGADPDDIAQAEFAPRPDSDDSADFSLDRYQPMATPLGRRRPGLSESRSQVIERKWARAGSANGGGSFGYISAELKADFRRLHAQAREMVAESGADSAGLVEVLMKQQFTFCVATTALEFRLALQSMGIGQSGHQRP